VNQTRFTQTDGNGFDRFDFVCEGCGSEGEIRIAKGQGMRPFGCPNGCGATYVRWRPDGFTPALKCVVKPVLRTEFWPAALDAYESATKPEGAK